VVCVRFVRRADPHYLAGTALIESESLVWTLEGDTFKEAQELLKSDSARRIVAEGATLSDPEKEQRLRALVRAKRQRRSLDAAGRLLATMNSKSREIVAEGAVRLGVQPEEFILEWLTYEAALDFAMMDRIWKQQGNFKGGARQIVGTLLEGVQGAPAIDKGVVVLAKTDHRIVVGLFGAKVIEGILPPESEAVRGLATDSSNKVFWTSNYNYLRQVLSNRLPCEIREEQIVVENGRYVVDYAEWFEDFLKKGMDIRWASLISDGSPLSIAFLAEEQEVLSQANTPKPTPAVPRDNLREVFATWARSVPLIMAIGEYGDATGSGFLVDHRGKLLVVTNRHVVEGAAKGIRVMFFQGLQRTDERTLDILPEDVQVIAVHRFADVALLDISKAQGRVRAAGILPVLLAAKTYVPEVGNHVFAIGHPGGSGEEILTRTLSDGIISAVGRQRNGCRFIQMTVPINPGNSGGPLFDDEGRVVGINTSMVRKSASRDIALEALNFALEIGYVHELLTDNTASMSPDQIANVLRPALKPGLAALGGRNLARMFDKLQEDGFKPYGGSIDNSVRACTLSADSRRLFGLTCERGREYAMIAASDGSQDIDLVVVDSSNTVLASDTDPAPIASVTFRAPSASRVALVVINSSETDASVIMAVLER
jgi:S1-C subfamily serine protease